MISFLEMYTLIICVFYLFIFILFVNNVVYENIHGRGFQNTFFVGLEFRERRFFYVLFNIF